MDCQLHIIPLTIEPELSDRLTANVAHNITTVNQTHSSSRLNIISTPNMSPKIHIPPVSNMSPKIHIPPVSNMSPGVNIIPISSNLHRVNIPPISNMSSKINIIPVSSRLPKLNVIPIQDNSRVTLNIPVIPQLNINLPNDTLIKISNLKLLYACSNRIVPDTSFFDIVNELPTDQKNIAWEFMYDKIMDAKYKKGTRNFSRTITGISQPNTVAPIYLIPRERGGPGYHSIELSGIDKNDVQYCPISKGFSMQDVSSFTLGPIVDQGLCLVNSAFSKCICVAHIEGGGKINLKRKCFWQRTNKIHRRVIIIDTRTMYVDNVKYLIHDWLRDNEQLWYPDWEQWRRSVALCSLGDFHWTEDLGPNLAFRKDNEYLNFVQWKAECYIRPSYELLPLTSVYQFLHMLWKDNNIPLGLVHPKAMKNEAETPITREFIRDMYDSPDIMCCQPYVVAGKLMNVEI